MMRLLIRQTLERTGIVCHEAEHRGLALERLPEVQPDLVLLDVVMPQMDGYAACSALRQTSAGAFVPVLMLTGLDDVESIDRAESASNVIECAQRLGGMLRFYHRAAA